MKTRETLKFFRLIKNRKNSERDYIAFQEFQAGKVLENISKHYTLKGKTMLDLGCGRGGYTKIFKKAGAKVISLDLEIPQVKKIFPAFVNGDAIKLPFKDNSFDFIFSSSLIEHLPKPYLLVKEARRVLKKNGIFFLSFPPFYTPVGGHQFKPFNMFLPEKAAAFAARKLYGIRSYKYNDSYGKLYIITIRKAKKLIADAGLKIIRTKTRFSWINFSKIPLLNEVMTWHVEFYLKK